ncbi:DNA-binding FrmR family transcriptional regulator [Xanthomonas arboricola]|nr:DNA-binding FrmR family transcriptional regulator [Xanthomonas arboricola]
MLRLHMPASGVLQCDASGVRHAESAAAQQHGSTSGRRLDGRLAPWLARMLLQLGADPGRSGLSPFSSGLPRGHGFFRANPYTAPQYLAGAVMPHSPQEKKRALARVRRLRGQCDALERALEAGADCAPVLQQIAAIRGAVNGLMSQVLEAHIREDFGHAAASDAQRAERVQELLGLVRSYLK